MNLELQTSNKNKEMIIENVLEQNIIFSIDFNKEGSFRLDDNILDSSLKYFCNGFIQDQNIYLQSLVFDPSKIKDKKILIIFSESFEDYANELKKIYPNELYFYLDRNNYEDAIKDIFNVHDSIDKHLKISKLDGINSIFSKKKIESLIAENIYDDDYEILINMKNHYLYSKYKIKDFDQKISQFYDLKENIISSSKMNSKKYELLNREKKHIKRINLKTNI